MTDLAQNRPNCLSKGSGTRWERQKSNVSDLDDRGPLAMYPACFSEDKPSGCVPRC